LSRDWNATFSSWSAAPSATEQAKCENAERAVRKAMDGSSKLAPHTIEVFTQGSYANRTNVRQDSDVDICILFKDVFFTDYTLSEGLNNSAVGLSDASYTYSDFKNDVEAALVSHFGRASVARGKKAFDVHANTYRIDADVVPCLEHRRYMGTPQYHWYEAGTELRPDNGGRIINWPKQNYRNGVAKNDATGRGFKGVTRILKRLRYELIDEGYTIAEAIPSYLIECLVWNVPNEYFGHALWKDDVHDVIAHLWNETRTDESCKEWGEVNELKYLFRAAQPWTRSGVNSFLQVVWDYIGFE